MEQCNVTNLLEGMIKMIKESKTKTEMIKTLSERVNAI